ncbi:hypothetical protein MSG28_000539 [Choristoneura fumiferana]|uniref:Uncharacterized protein n=1 Tax=Choristoneura fumiferana TaxID=7141 RepID=A0ACC0K1N6_CHOFU|nr:hypothetical protein MSG28_000539 [Choristoneura fumiferana]
MVSPRFHTGITVKPMGPMASTNPSEHPRSNFKSTNETMFVKINVKMTSEGEADKTTEFVRRRKLRLQQVREQSKDIAKLIRQRAKIEKLRQVVELDANQEKDYLQRQEKVVKKLEELYSKGLQNFGTSHKDASGLKQPGNILEKTDLSRLRGKEAAAELKRSKQQKLDEQKKTLDRKIQAREAANIISREKSTTAASKLSTKSSTNKLSEVSKSDGKIETAHKSSSEISGDNAGDKVVTRNDMGTQWDTEILPLEWEPNIPALPIPKDDSNKESMCIDTENNTEKKKRPNLFALSDEMPSSLRGSCYPIIINEPAKPSLTLVSEYIQNRALRLRETPVSNSNKKNSADLQNLKQTILRTRSLRAEDTRDVPFADEQIVVRDMHSNKDAYIEALSEAASNTEEKQNKKLQDVSTKIAVTRQSVEKEYKDTMAFLNGLPKSKGLSTKPIKNAYKDDYRLNQQKENRQKILQQEFKNMEKEASQQRYSVYTKLRMKNKKLASVTSANVTTYPDTSRTIGDEMNFMKLAEDKLHNMEKIADLTEKCTKRLSNLAKVLEEVRKNKSLAYSQISTSDSTDSDQKSDQAIIAANPEQQLPNLPVHVTGKNLEAAYESLLFGIPKPGYIESPLNTDSENEFSNNNNNEATPITPPLITTNVEYRNNNHPKYRTKPPPALLRMHLKRPEENVVPHELSTVIEVDSPLSVKLKNQSSNADNASQSNKHLTETRAEEKNDNLFADKEFQIPLAPSDSGMNSESTIGDGKRSATHVSPVLPTNHRFLEPERAVKTITDMAVWEKSEAYMEYTGFIATINEAIKGKPLSVDCKVNDNVKKLLHVLEEIGKYIEEFPPVEQPQRFGNTAFREWLEKVKCNTTILLQGMLELPLQLAIPEIKVYLEESFGNATRIDYGTGHEMSFVMFLCCLYKIGFLIPEDNVSTVFLVFNKYLNIARTLQKTYRMEPAGSHGVWSLDDYQFIPFIWGSAQLVDQPKIYPPVKFLDDDIIDKYANDYMFLSCIKYIKDVKKGPFAEHSNQLWSISAVSSWSKINQGLIKMYKKEVLSKFPVVQHVLFGSLLPIRRFPINH